MFRTLAARPVLAVLAALALLAHPVPTHAESFHEPFEADIDQNHVPDFWSRVIAPGLPRYNDLDFPDREVFHAGASSVRFRMHGGSALLRCQRLLAVNPGLVYELSGRIRTRGFDRNAAFLAVEWLDRSGSLLRTDRTDPVGGTSDWSRVELRFEELAPEARFARLVCSVEGDDLAGDAWFDEIHWTEKTALQTLAPGHPGNVFAEGEEVQVLVRAPTLLRGSYELRTRIVRFDGTELAVPPPAPVEVGKDDSLEVLYAPPIRETGYFDLWLEIRRGDELLAAGRMPIGVVPRLRTAAAGPGEYGVVVDPFERKIDRLLGHLSGLGLGRAKVVLADRRDPAPPRPLGEADPVERAILALRQMGIDPIGILPAPRRVPNSDRSAGGGKIDGLAAWLALPTEAWEPGLLDLMRRYQGHLSRWQLGEDGDFTLQARPDREALLTRVADAVAKVTRYPILGVGVDPTAPGAAETTAHGRLQFVSLVLPRTITPVQVEQALAAIPGAGGASRPVTYAIPEIFQVERYAGMREQIVQLVQSALHARRAGARETVFLPLAGVQTGLFDLGADPTPAYFAVRTLNLLLSGSRLDPRSFVHDPAVESPVFERAGDRVIALWRRPGARVRELSLPIGEQARVLDPTGRVLEVPRADIERRIEASDTPVYLVDLDRGLVETQLSIGFDGRRVRLRTGRQRETLRLSNSFPEAIRNVEMRVRLPEEARSWRLELLERRRTRMAPGESWEVPVEIDLPQNEGVDTHVATVEVRFETDLREYRFAVLRRIVLAADILLTMEARPDPAAGLTVVTLAARNTTDRAMDLKCYLFAEGRPVEPRLLPRLAPGAQETLRFVLTGAAAVQGREVRAHVEEIRGAAFANRSLVLE